MDIFFCIFYINNQPAKLFPTVKKYINTIIKGQRSRIIVKYKVKQNGDAISWDPKQSLDEVEIDLHEVAIDLVKKELRNLDAKNKLEEKHFTLYEKFIGE